MFSNSTLKDHLLLCHRLRSSLPFVRHIYRTGKTYNCMITLNNEVKIHITVPNGKKGFGEDVIELVEYTLRNITSGAYDTLQKVQKEEMECE